jgi:hypothetical protein
VVNAVVPPEGRDRSILVGSRVGSDSTNDGKAAWTGHSVLLPDAIWVVVSFFSSFFCISKVRLRQPAYSKEGSLCLTRRPFLKKQRFRRQRISVRCFSCCGTSTYSQERMAKKKGEDGELQYGALQLSQIPFCNLGYDAGGVGFLLLFFGVGIFVGSELLV